MRMRALEGVLQKGRVGEIRLEERLANYTYMGVGGPCRALVRPPDLASLERLIMLIGEMEIPYLAIGGGTNLLVSDEGFEGSRPPASYAGPPAGTSPGWKGWRECRARSAEQA